MTEKRIISERKKDFMELFRKEGKKFKIREILRIIRDILFGIAIIGLLIALGIAFIKTILNDFF